jgi:hypothetical protein
VTLFAGQAGYGSVAVSSPALPAAVGLLCVAFGIILRIGMMPVFRKPRPLWHLLVMLGCAIVVPLLLYGTYAGFRFTDAQLRDARDDLAIEARTLSANIDREVIGEIDRLQALAASPSLRQGDFADFQHQAEASLALRRSGNIVLIDRNMQQLVNTAVPFGKPLPKAGAPEVAERALATGQPQASDLFWAPVTQRLLVTIIVPVQIRGENQYALARSARTAHLRTPGRGKRTACRLASGDLRCYAPDHRTVRESACINRAGVAVGTVAPRKTGRIRVCQFRRATVAGCQQIRNHSVSVRACNSAVSRPCSAILTRESRQTRRFHTAWVIRYRSLHDENRSMSAMPRKRRLAVKASSVAMGQKLSLFLP